MYEVMVDRARAHAAEEPAGGPAPHELACRTHHGAKFLRRVRNRKITLVTIPNSHPRIAVTRMSQTSDWRVDPSTQLTLTVRVWRRRERSGSRGARRGRPPRYRARYGGHGEGRCLAAAPRRSFLRPTLLVHARSEI